MDYKVVYDNLISTRKSRAPLDTQYYEKHHILPKSKGGSNSKDNLINLTPREHFLAHWLLWKIYKDSSTRTAFHMMRNSRKNMKRILTSKQYEIARNVIYEKITNGNHHFIGGKIQKETQDRLVKAGKHHWLSGESQRENALKRLKENTHHFKESAFNKKAFKLYVDSKEYSFTSKVEAVKYGFPAHVIDKLRKNKIYKPDFVTKKAKNLYSKESILKYEELI